MCRDIATSHFLAKWITGQITASSDENEVHLTPPELMTA
jgi:hypothetical protein